jgi:hypothetical protein
LKGYWKGPKDWFGYGSAVGVKLSVGRYSDERARSLLRCRGYG